MCLEANLSKVPTTKTIYLRADLGNFPTLGQEYCGAFEEKHVKLDGNSLFWPIGQAAMALEHFSILFQFSAYMKVKEEKNIYSFIFLTKISKSQFLFLALNLI